MKSLVQNKIHSMKKGYRLIEKKYSHLNKGLFLVIISSFFMQDIQAQVSFDLSDRNGHNIARFRDNVASYNLTGSATATGDINGDGFEDLIIGSPESDANSKTGSGKVFVVFGSDEGIRASTNLSTLDGTTGFVINGTEANDNIGNSVSSGDIDGDGFDDIIFGAEGADSNTGEVYVLYGKSSFSASIEKNTVDGSGILVRGLDTGDNMGRSVISGDINNDTFDDLIIGAPAADPNGVTSGGETYVIFGSNSISGTFSLSLMDSTEGFILNGNSNTISSGESVASGDFNNDGIDDILIGAPLLDSSGDDDTGGALVFFGKDTTVYNSSYELSSLNGSNGFEIEGISQYDVTGTSVSIGDINGDQVDDIIVGSIQEFLSITGAGETYVIYGKSSFTTPFALSTLDGSNGFKLTGITSGDRSGEGVAAGDVNGDGFDDLIIGAPKADSGSVSNAGATFIVFGKSSFSSSMSLSSLDKSTGFTIYGNETSAGIGTGNSAGDFNGDGVDEVFVGVKSEDSNSGAAYIVFNTLAQKITGDEGFRMLSAPTNGYTFDELLGDFWTQGFTGADAISGSANTWTWDESSQSWTALSNQSSDSLAPGNGFLFYLFSDDNGSDSGDAGFPKMINASQYGGDGNLNEGTVSPISDLADGDFFLMGNPYTGTMDWDRSAVTKTNLSNAIYIYDDENSTFQSWNGSVGNISNGRISSFQSFFIQASGGVGEISITESAVINNGASNVTGLLKTNASEEPRVLKLTAKSGVLMSDAWLSFQEGGEVSKDIYDGLSLQSLSSNYLRLATIIETDELLQINVLPLDQSNRLSFPLEISGTMDSTTASVSFEGLEVFEGWKFSLYDSEIEEFFLIEEGSVLELEIRKITGKEASQPKLPTPIPLKAKVGTTRYQIIIQPNTSSVNNEESTGLAKVLSLDQNYPNPFNPSTTINFGVPEQGNVRLEVFDMLGRKVSELLNEPKTAGRYSVNFDASQLASGLYIYRLQVGSVVLTKKMTLIK